ncbi:MAG TPA: PxKF domain-containing protein [Rubrobacteraceae bacterium]|nr:PxKF domain-containing protein [Rubrobacteraceae bacterium]
MLRGKLTLLFMSFALVLAIPTVALGDNVQTNDVDTGANTSKEPGQSGTANVRIVGTNSPGGDFAGCNVSTTNPATVSFSGSPSGKVTFDGSGSVQITECGSSGAKQLGYQVSSSAQPGDVITVSTSTTGGATGSKYSEDSFTISVTSPPVPSDTTAPVITDVGPTYGPDGSNDWYKSAVTNQFRAADAGSGFASPLTNPYTFTQSSGADEGSAVKINSGPVSDVAGNTNPGIDSTAFKIDLSDPVVNITNAPAEDAKVGICNGIPSPSYTANDVISGVATESDAFTLQPNANSGVGTYTYRAEATDNAGRSGSATRSYSVVYGGAYGGVLQPINANGTSNFKLGSTVPVKFKLECSSGSIANAVAHISVKKVAGGSGEINENISTSAPHDGTQFRYDATNQQYIFNLSTKPLSAGQHEVTIALNDGTTRTASFDLRK